MNKKWTIRQLNGMDPFTFAICIMSERRAMLNQEAPLTKKLKCVSDKFEELRDICRADKTYMDGLISEKRAIYDAECIEHKYADIKMQLGLDPDDPKDCDVNLHGMTPEEVASNREIMKRILERIEKCGCTGDYWANVDYSISQSVKDMLDARKRYKNTDG